MAEETKTDKIRLILIIGRGIEDNFQVGDPVASCTSSIRLDLERDQNADH